MQKTVLLTNLKKLTNEKTTWQIKFSLFLFIFNFLLWTKYNKNSILFYFVLFFVLFYFIFFGPFFPKQIYTKLQLTTITQIILWIIWKLCFVHYHSKIMIAIWLKSHLIIWFCSIWWNCSKTSNHNNNTSKKKNQETHKHTNKKSPSHSPSMLLTIVAKRGDR